MAALSVLYTEAILLTDHWPFLNKIGCDVNMHDQSAPPRHRKRLTLASALVAAAIVTSLTGVAPANADTQRCTYGSSSGNIHTCITVTVGSSTTTATAKADVINDGRYLQVCVNTPIIIICTPSQGYIFIDKGGFISAKVTLTGSPSGQYCANTYRRNADLSRTQIGHVCVTI